MDGWMDEWVDDRQTDDDRQMIDRERDWYSYKQKYKYRDIDEEMSYSTDSVSLEIPDYWYQK